MYQVFNFISALPYLVLSSACPYFGSVPQPADCAIISLHTSIQFIHAIWFL